MNLLNAWAPELKVDSFFAIKIHVQTVCPPPDQTRPNSTIVKLIGKCQKKQKMLVVFAWGILKDSSYLHGLGIWP